MTKENNLAIQGGNCSRCTGYGYRRYCFKDEEARAVRILSINCHNCFPSSSGSKPKAGPNEVEIDFESALELINSEGWVSTINGE